MKPSIRDAVARCGYAFIPGYRLGEDSVAVASSLGEPLAPWDGRLIQELIPRTAATPNTYSGIYGLQSFPFHTDLAHWRVPPRYLFLRCVTGYAEVPTLLLDGQGLVDAATSDLLARAIFIPRRPQNGALTLLRLCEHVEQGLRLRWDAVFLKPASKVGDTANELVRAWLAEAEPISAALMQMSDTLLIDNWRMLHARAPIPSGCEDRKIERIYLEALH